MRNNENLLSKKEQAETSSFKPNGQVKPAELVTFLFSSFPQVLQETA